MNNFNPSTYQGIANARMGMNSFKEGYQQNTAMIDRQDYTNQKNALHNNMGDNLLSEHIAEYQITVSSYNRDPSSQPDPFNFTTYFDSGSSNQIPSISKKFVNVKYINLEYVFLPRTNIVFTPASYTAVSLSSPVSGPPMTVPPKYINPPSIEGNSVTIVAPPVDVNCIIPLPSSISGITNGGSISAVTLPYDVTGNKSTYSMVPSGIDDLKNHKFLKVVFEEISSSRSLSTSRNATDISFILVYDITAGLHSGLWKPKFQNSKVFPTSLLGRISRLTPVLYDEYDNRITIMQRSITFDGSTNIATYTDIPCNLSADYNLYKSYPSSFDVDNVKTLYNLMQMNYMVVLGVVENEMNTLTKFER